MKRQPWRYYNSMGSGPPLDASARCHRHYDHGQHDHHQQHQHGQAFVEKVADEWEEQGFEQGTTTTATIYTDLPSRLDQLPFSAYHWFLVVSLGVTWMLDGLEVTVVSVLSAHLKREDTLGLTDVQVGLTVSLTLLGAILGSVVFGYLCDRYGRKKLYLATPIVYSVATGLSAFCWEFYGFAAMRFITGAGLGGEYSAMNSAIDELIPAKVRGRVDLAVNGSYWFGAALAAAISLFILDPHFLGSADFGWRFMFGLGALLGVVIVLLRLALPESPRWLMTRGRMDEAERVVSDMEAKAVRWNTALGARLPAFLASCFLSLSSPRHSPVATHASSSGGYDVSSNEYDAVDEEEGEKEGHVIAIVPRRSTPLREVVGAIFLRYPRHTVLGLSLMVAQAFFYNAIFFSYAIILVEFYGVASEKVGLYLVPFAIGNFLGPITLGPLFDTIGRRQMIALTYSLSAVLLIITGWLFAGGMIGALVQAVLWSVVFFFSSPAASAAYLTVSEIFPLEIRALAISFFYSVGTGLGGVAAPLLFGWLLETGRAENIFYGYVLAAALMLVAAIVETVIGVDAEQKSLESITAPLSAAPAPASPSTGASSLASSTSSLFVSTPHSSSFSSLPLPPQSSLRSSSSRSHTRPWRAHHDLAALRSLGSLTPSYHHRSSPSPPPSSASPALSSLHRTSGSSSPSAFLLAPSFVRSLSTSSSLSASSVPSPAHASPSVPPAVSRDEREMDDIDLSEDRQQQQQQQLRPGVPDIPKQLLPAAGSAQHD